MKDILYLCHILGLTKEICGFCGKKTSRDRIIILRDIAKYGYNLYPYIDLMLDLFEVKLMAIL